MREVSRVADKRLVAEAEGSEIDGDLLARREHHRALPQGRPDHHDTQRVPRDVLAQRAELPEQVAEQLGRVARVDELFHTQRGPAVERRRAALRRGRDRKSTRLNSSHGYISYAVFCLKKKKKK